MELLEEVAERMIDAGTGPQPEWSIMGGSAKEAICAQRENAAMEQSARVHEPPLPLRCAPHHCTELLHTVQC